MAWFLSDSLAEYAASADGLLRGSPARNTILLGAAETLRARGRAAFGGEAPLFGWWAEPDGEVTAAFLHTPPYQPVLTSMPERQAAALAQALAARRRPATGVNGDEPAAAAFAAAWQQLTGDTVTLAMRSRLYRLGRLRPPQPMPPGQARLAGPADRGPAAGLAPGLPRRGARRRLGGFRGTRSMTGSATAGSRCGRRRASRSPWPG